MHRPHDATRTGLAADLSLSPQNITTLESSGSYRGIDSSDTRSLQEMIGGVNGYTHAM
jgi:hypothetical protein